MPWVLPTKERLSAPSLRERIASKYFYQTAARDPSRSFTRSASIRSKSASAIYLNGAASPVSTRCSANCLAPVTPPRTAGARGSSPSGRSSDATSPAWRFARTWRLAKRIGLTGPNGDVTALGMKQQKRLATASAKQTVPLSDPARRTADKGR